MPILKHRPPSPEAPVPVFGTGREKIPSPILDADTTSDKKPLTFSRNLFLQAPSKASLAEDASTGEPSASSTSLATGSLFATSSVTSEIIIPADTENTTASAEERKLARALRFQSKQQPATNSLPVSPTRPVKRPASSENLQESAKVCFIIYLTVLL